MSDGRFIRLGKEIAAQMALDCCCLDLSQLAPHGDRVTLSAWFWLFQLEYPSL